MAKIYIKSRREPIVIDNEKALMIKNDWLKNSASKDIVEVDGESFRISDIKSISGAVVRGDDYAGKKYDLDVPEDRKKVRDLEAEYLSWRAGEGKQYSGSMVFPRFLESKGACEIRGEGIRQSDVVVVDTVLYDRISRLWSSLQNLRLRRQRAKKSEAEATEALIKQI